MSLVFLSFLTETTGYVFMNEVSFFVQRLVGLRYMVIILFIGCHINNLVSYYRIGRVCFVNLSVRSLNKTILIDSCIGSKRVDKTDVRTLRSLDRTHTSIMRIVNVSNLESGSVSGQTAWSQGRQTSLMGQLT